MAFTNSTGKRGLRQYRRVDVDACAWVRNKTSSARRPPEQDDPSPHPNGGVRAKVTNLSLRGAAVRGDSQLLGKVGRRIELLLPAANGKDIVLVSRVVRVQENGDGFVSGVRFSHASSEDKTRFLTLIRMLLSARD